MKPKDFTIYWDVLNECGDCIVHFKEGAIAVKFMQDYGHEGWLCLQKTIYFADKLDLSAVYDSVTVEIEGDWVSYSEFGPRYSTLSESEF